MRVISGYSKGRVLKSPKGNNTRPTSDKVKGAFFNILSDYVHEAVFLDLFAGTGSIGIEALSRGAEKCVFIEKDPHAVTIIKANLLLTGMQNNGKILACNINRGLKILAKKKESFDIIYLDPALAPAFISGLLEVDLGCQQASTIPNIPMDQRIIALGAIIAWSGLSVHAQVASIISSTDINITPYIYARVIHAVLAGLYSMLLLGTLQFPLITEQALPVFLSTIPSGNIPYWFQRTIFMGGRFFLILTSLLMISLTIYCIEKYIVKNKIKHQKGFRRS